MIDPSAEVFGRNFLSGQRGTSAASGRDPQLLSGVVALVAAAPLNWSWPAAAVIISVVLAVLPCAMICELHLSAHKNGERDPDRAA